MEIVSILFRLHIDVGVKYQKKGQQRGEYVTISGPLN